MSAPVGMSMKASGNSCSKGGRALSPFLILPPEAAIEANQDDDQAPPLTAEASVHPLIPYPNGDIQPPEDPSRPLESTT